MSDVKYKMSIGRTRTTGIILEKELSTDEVYQIIMGQQKEIERLEQFKDNVFDAIDKRINTLEANSHQCHQSESHEKGMEFTLQAELLERLKKELKEYD